MLKGQTDHFRARIEAELDSFTERTTALKRELLQSAEVQPRVLLDGLDHAKEEAELGTRLDLNERDQAHGARLRAALRRIEQGDFGRCDGCGDSIEMARMNAAPAAALCVVCQDNAEKTNATMRPRRKRPCGFLFDYPAPPLNPLFA